MTELKMPALPYVAAEIQVRIEQFLAYEAELLDDRKFREWLSLFSSDTHYWMPIRSSRTPRERHLELTGPGALASFDETKADLEQRIRKIETGKAWAEEPPSRTRHCLSNVRVRMEDGLYAVRSNIVVFQSRAERDEYQFFGERFDVLQPADDTPEGFRIKSRKIVLDQTTLLAPSLSIFF